jgi:hypothetical protein
MPGRSCGLADIGTQSPGCWVILNKAWSACLLPLVFLTTALVSNFFCNMMKKLFAVAFLLCVFPHIQAQSYMTAAGLRFGTDWGITLQQRIAKKTTIEGILQSSLQREEVLLTGLVEQHYPILTKGLNVYFGGGMHKGWISGPSDAESQARPYEDPFGVTLIAGAEITLGRINVSYDFKPAINLSGGEEKFYTQTGVSVRYALLNNKVYKKMAKKKRKKQRQKEGKDGWMFWKKDK